MKFVFTLGLLVWAFLGQSLAASLSGKVILRGVSPPEIPIKEIDPKDPTCGKVHAQPAKTRFYVVDADGGLADVVVSVKQGVPHKVYPVPAEPKIIDQVGCEFVPYVISAMAGQKVQIKNSDPFMHNINHAPVADLQKRPQNVAQMAGAKIVERTFALQPDQQWVRLKCDVHPWMFAYVAVFDHPFHAVTGKDGSFHLPPMPPGKYVIEAYHRKLGRLTRELVLAEVDEKLEFVFEAKPAP